MIKVLNGLRGYAALFVIIGHLPQITNSLTSEFFNNAISFSRLAYISVDIFFILSGYLITRNLIIEKEKNGNISIKNFFYRRFLRIFPIYYLTTFIVYLIFNFEGLIYVNTYLSNFFFVFYNDANPLRHTWSLAVEEHFYLLWPVLFYFVPLSKLKKITYYFTIIIVSTSFIFLLYMYNDIILSKFIQKTTNFRLLSLIGGCLIALKKNELNKLLISNHKLLLLSTFLYSIAIFSRLIFTPGLNYTITLYLFSFLGSCTFFLFVLKNENQKSFFNKCFSNKLILYFGKISYGLYLYHYPIYFYFGITELQLINEKISFITIGEFISPILLTFIISILSFHLIEAPLSSLKRYFK